MTLQCLNLECKFLPNAWVEYKWAQREENKLVHEIPRRNSQRQQKDVVFSVRWVLTSEQGRRGDGGGSKVRSPGRRFSQMSISPLNPLFSWGHPLFTCWLCGCVLRLQTCSSRGLSPCHLIIARVTDSIKRWHLRVADSVFFFFFWKDENLFWSLRGSGLQLREVESSRCVCY